MAARKRNWTPEIVRERIRTSMLVNRLTDHVLGKVILRPEQVTAALGLLRKSLPDLTATEISGSIEQRTVSADPLSADEWESRYGVGTPAGTAESPN